MEQLMEMLKTRFPAIDFENEKTLTSSGILDSLAVVAIIAEIEAMFDVAVTMEYIHPRHFESVEAMWAMVEELMA